MRDDDAIFINSGGGQNYEISNNGIIKTQGYFNGRNDINRVDIFDLGNNNLFSKHILFNEFNNEIDVRVDGRQVRPNIILPATGYYSQFGSVRLGGSVYFFAGKVLIKISPGGHCEVRQFPTEILCSYAASQKIWLGLRNAGIICVDESLHVVASDILSDFSITSICTDYEGGFLFSTLENGIYYLRSFDIYKVKGDSSLSKSIGRIYNVQDSSILFSTSVGFYQLKNGKVLVVLKEASKYITDLLLNNKSKFFL